jgi:hypothetical protein
MKTNEVQLQSYAAVRYGWEREQASKVSKIELEKA